MTYHIFCFLDGFRQLLSEDFFSTSNQCSSSAFIYQRFSVIFFISRRVHIRKSFLQHSFWHDFKQRNSKSIWKVVVKKHLYTFVPFQFGKCHDTQPIVISEFIEKSWTSTHFFLKKLSNLHNCTIKANALNKPFTVIKTKSLNFYVDIDCSETLLCSIFDNFTATENIKRICESTDDLILGSYFLRENRAKFLID